MFSFFKRYRVLLGVAALFSLAINLALLAPSLFMLQVFDRVLTSRSMETLVMLGLVTGGALLLMMVLDALRARLLLIVGVLLDNRIGPTVLERLVRDASRVGQSAYVYGLRDLGLVRGFLSGTGIMALFDLPWMGVYLGLIFLFSPLLGCIASAGASVLMLLAVLNERLTRRTIARVQVESRDAGRFVEATLRNAEVVRALGMLPAVVRKWQGLNGRVLHLQLSLHGLGGAVSAATKFFRQFIQVLMLGAGAYLVIEQRATSGVMIAATIILGRALAPVETLIASWKSLVDARAARSRLNELVREEARYATQVDLPPPEGRIALENVSYVPPGATKPIVRGLSLDIAAGETLAVIGPSGSGKSTLLRLIVGVWSPSAGTVRIDGADIAAWDRGRLGPWIGYLPQDVQLFAASVGENIARLGEIDSKQVLQAATSAHAHDFVVRLSQGYDTPVGEGGALLSGGQRQRVGLARALYGDPRIVALDEPNANLDSEGEQALARALEELKAARVTVVFVTQRPNILPLADRVVVMKEGSIEQIGVKAQAGAKASTERVPVSPVQVVT